MAAKEEIKIRFETEQRVAKHLKKIYVRMNQVMRIQSKQVFRELDSFHKKRFHLNLLNKNLELIEGILNMMRLKVNGRKPYYKKRRNRSAKVRQKKESEKFASLVKAREDYLLNLNELCNLFFIDLTKSSYTEQ